MTLFFFLLTLFLFFLGTPIFAALGIGSGLLGLYAYGLPPASIANMFVSSLHSFTLLAIPLFVFMGDLFLASGADKPLLRLIRVLFGHLRGSTGIASVVACAFFAAISGSSTATVLTIGIIMLPEMEKQKYEGPFASAIIAASGGLGNLIPPSVFFIIYGALYELDIATLFAAGFVPGILSAALLSGAVYILARIKKVPLAVDEEITWQDRIERFVRALPAICIPVVILGGIYLGIFTPTEAAAVGCAVVIIVGLIYRKMTLGGLWTAAGNSARTLGAIMVMIAGGIIIGKMFVLSGVPDFINEVVTQRQISPHMFLFLAGVVMAILGTFIECVLMIYVSAALFYPTIELLGLSPIHFGVTIVVASLIGMTTPPMCESIFVVSKISKVDSGQIMGEIYPFILVWLINFAIIISFPEISLIIPQLLGRL